MDKCIDSLGDAAVVLTLHAKSRLRQLEIAKEDRDKAAFTSHHGLLRFTRMPFEVRDTPGTFQLAMDVLMTKVNLQFALAYLDDIVIFSCTPDEHNDHV